MAFPSPSGPGIIEASEGAPCASFHGRSGFTGIEGGGGEQFGVGFVFLALACEQQAEGEVRFEGVGIGLDGAAVEAGSCVEVILMVGDVAGVEEGASVGGVGGEVRIELGCGGFPVGFDDVGFGVGEFRRDLLGLSICLGGLAAGGACARDCESDGKPAKKTKQDEEATHEVPQIQV